MSNHSTNLDQIYFINIFYAFISYNNLCLFEHANELIDEQIHLTLFLKFTMILNQKATIWSWAILYYKPSENLGESPRKKLMEVSYF